MSMTHFSDVRGLMLIEIYVAKKVNARHGAETVQSRAPRT